jgi:hypothetical protein
MANLSVLSGSSHVLSLLILSVRKLRDRISRGMAVVDARQGEGRERTNKSESFGNIIGDMLVSISDLWCVVIDGARGQIQY